LFKAKRINYRYDLNYCQRWIALKNRQGKLKNALVVEGILGYGIETTPMSGTRSCPAKCLVSNSEIGAFSVTD
jgi:hypothetical protein